MLRHDLAPKTRDLIVGIHIVLGFVTLLSVLLVGLRAALQRRGPLEVGLWLVFVSGVVATGFGASRAFALIGAAHAVIATVFIVARLVPRRLAFAIIPFAAAIVGSLSYGLTAERAPTVEPVYPTGPIDPTPPVGYVDTSALLPGDAARFTDVTRCDVCHAALTDDFHRSVHRHASLTNPYYVSSVRRLIDERGPDAAAACAGCHDLGLVAHGRFPDALTVEQPDVPPRADIGIPCLACHGATQVRSQRGNGALALALPRDPIVTSDGLEHFLHFLLTYADPRAHREQMMRPDTKSSTRCGTCHQAFLHEGINGIAHTRGQTERDDHRNSAYFPAAGPTGRLPLDVGPQSCVDCHMSEGAQGHATFAAHTALATFRGDAAAVDAITAQLQPEDPFVRLSWVSVDRGVVRPSDGRLPARNSSAQLHLLITNERVGHAFPAGTKDTHDLRLEVSFVDEDGRSLPLADDAPHALGTAMLDAAGAPNIRHDTQSLWTALFEHSLLPGHGHIVRYQLERAPSEERPVRAVARLVHRKFRPAFSAAVDAPPAPEVVIADTAAAPPLPAAVRLARYADAAAANWEDELAKAAIDEANSHVRGPEDAVEVQLARARFLLERKRQYAVVTDLLADVPDPRARALLGRALLDGGNATRAREVLEDLTERFGNDLELLLRTAEARRRTGSLPGALELVDEVIAAAPDHFRALQLEVALAGELGDKDRARRAREQAERVRPDRDAQLAAVERQKRDQVADREADRAHVHQLRTQAAAAAAPAPAPLPGLPVPFSPRPSP